MQNTQKYLPRGFLHYMLKGQFFAKFGHTADTSSTTNIERKRGKRCRTNIEKLGTVGVTQLVEKSIPTPEDRSLNAVIGKFYIEHCFLSTVLNRQE